MLGGGVGGVLGGGVGGVLGGGVVGGLRSEEGAPVSCLLRQPRYRLQEVRVPFERIGRVLGLLMPGMRVVHGPSRVLWPP